MEFIIDGETTDIDTDTVCPASACAYFTGCPKNKSFCVIEFGGPKCTTRSCVGYFS